MAMTWIRRLRRTVGLIWVALLVVLLGIVGVTVVAPRLGMTIYIIRGGSMAPAIPLGAIVADIPADTASLAVGEVITIKTPGGIVYTHRIVSIDTSGPERSFRVQGDANASPDPSPLPASAVIGKVSYSAPVVGYVLALLALPMGILSVMTMLGSLLLTYWLLEDLEDLEVLEREPATAGVTGATVAPGPRPEPQLAPQTRTTAPTSSASA